MSISFDTCIAYEERDYARTSRWKLDGIKTLAAGNTDGGWLWFSIAVAADLATVSVYKDSAGANLVAQVASVDVSDVDTAAVKCTLAEKNSSGITGECYIEYYSADVTLVPLLVSLCVDADLDVHYSRLDDLPTGIYSSTAGMAEYCAASTGHILRLVSQLYSGQLGGYGSLEHRNLGPADRLAPDYRKLADPKQLLDAAVHYALSLGFWAAHQMVDNTLYSEQGERHDTKYQDAVSSWNLAFMSDPDADHNAAETRSASSTTIERV